MLNEPHELWQNVGSDNLLEKFFKDQKRWAFTLQSYITLTRVQQLQQATKENRNIVKIIERSVYSARYCFAQNAFEMGLLTDLEWNLYQKFWDWDVSDHVPLPKGLIYLRIPASLCYERIMSRNRFEEQPISLEYLTNLETKHDDWLLHQKQVDNLHNIPILVLEDTKDLRSNISLQQDYVHKITMFLDSLS
ncbi:MAG: hypothetical protein CL947_01830 [Epsilonproteobacteria bacterium]|nr:hypothetical protein [Campylobacterota bacterium]